MSGGNMGALIGQVRDRSRLPLSREEMIEELRAFQAKRTGALPADAPCRQCILESEGSVKNSITQLCDEHRDSWSLDREIDGVTVRDLIARDQMLREERPSNYRRLALTPAQREEVSARWAAELRAKVAESAERERNRVRVDLEVEVYE